MLLSLYGSPEATSSLLLSPAVQTGKSFSSAPCFAEKEGQVCLCCVYAKLLQSCPALRNRMDCGPPGSSVHGDSPGKNTGMSGYALLQGIFVTQGSNLHLTLTSPALARRFLTTSDTWEGRQV